jgi:hypothetical protein
MGRGLRSGVLGVPGLGDCPADRWQVDCIENAIPTRTNAWDFAAVSKSTNLVFLGPDSERQFAYGEMTHRKLLPC